MIVLDTNVVSEPLRARPDAAVVQWLDAQDPRTLYLTAINVAELLAGVELLPAGRRKRTLKATLDERVFPLFAGRVLPFDEKAAFAFASLNAKAVASGNRVGFSDAGIAAIAQANGFLLATRNVKDFRGTGIGLVNPWTDL